MSTKSEKLDKLGQVIDTLDRLRVECPWDRKQTNESLRPNTIEEVYELCDALIKDDTQNIKKELGDVLLHVLFYSKIADEQGRFDIATVAEALDAKLKFRHPHIFGDVKVNNAHDVELNWEQLKLKEKGGNKRTLSGVPIGLPALIKSYRIQEKAANVGFDWDDNENVVDKVLEETKEFAEEVVNHDRTKMEEEFGDVLFSLVNLARKLDINPENALDKTNNKFIKRFNYIEDEAIRSGRKLTDMTLAEMDNLWDKAKGQTH